MPTSQASHADAMHTSHEQFVELFCADDDLVQAEFDAIVAAEWPSPPPAEPDDSADAGRPPRQARRPRDDGGAEPSKRPCHPGTGGWGRQRSPPDHAGHNQAPKTSARKAGDRPA